MRTVLQALRELLAPRLIQKEPLVLRESDSLSTCPATTIKRSGPAVAIRFEPWKKRDMEISTNEWLFALFNVETQGSAIGKSCDYVIFYAPPTGEAKVYVFLCELKSGGSKKTVAQLRNGKLIAEHILSVVGLHGNVQEQPGIEFRGLILANRAPSPKGSLRPSAPIRYEVDGDTGMRFVIMRPGGTHHLQIFCS